MEDPPSIINALICMGMMQEDKNAMFGEFVPWLLMVFTVLTVPMMLIPKPYLLWKQHQAQQAAGGFGHGGHGGGHGHVPLPTTDDESKLELDEEEAEHFDLAEV